MIVTMINDCAYVGFELYQALKELGISVRYLPRTRSIISKTLGALANSIKADGIIHVHYALQDAFFVSLLKDLHVLHVHGSDVRWALKGRWGRFIKHNLMAAKAVILATPDLEEYVSPFRKDALYLPTPIDTARFRPQNLDRTGPSKALYFKLWYEVFPNELVSALEAEGINLEIIENRPYDYSEMPKILSQYDIFIDRFSIPSFSKTCLEAMSEGLATIDYRHQDALSKRVRQLANLESRRQEGEMNRRYVEENHDRMLVAKKLLEIYSRVS